MFLYYFFLFFNSTTASITYRVRIKCDENYFNTTCTKFCRPRNDVFGHYTCDASGDKICMEGWVGHNCDTGRVITHLNHSSSRNYSYFQKNRIYAVWTTAQHAVPLLWKLLQILTLRHLCLKQFIANLFLSAGTLGHFGVIFFYLLPFFLVWFWNIFHLQPSAEQDVTVHVDPAKNQENAGMDNINTPLTHTQPHIDSEDWV